MVQSIIGSHFSGPSYIRDDSQTKVASEKESEELMGKRQAKATEILKWKGKFVTPEEMRRAITDPWVLRGVSSSFMTVINFM
jgi:hypothetical protein